MLETKLETPNFKTYVGVALLSEILIWLGFLTMCILLVVLHIVPLLLFELL